VPADALAVFGLAQLLAMQPAGPVVDPWDIPSGWRPGEHAWLTWSVRLPGGGTSPVAVAVAVRGTPADAFVRVGSGPPMAASVQPLGPVGEAGEGAELLVTFDGRSRRWQIAPARPSGPGDEIWVGTGGSAWPLVEQLPGAGRAEAGVTGSGQARSPMPGTVTAVHVAAGAKVAEGQPLVVVEAMKMEHPVPAPFAGYVKDVLVRPGDRVPLDALLAVIDPTAPDPGGTRA
jgi:acetyl-CoA/propionyl-CoA carboxylase biotin carboxyl carrier protein